MAINKAMRAALNVLSYLEPDIVVKLRAAGNRAKVVRMPGARPGNFSDPPPKLTYTAFRSQLQASARSLRNRYVVCFSGPFRAHDVEREFFRSLVQMEPDVEIAAAPPELE